MFFGMGSRYGVGTMFGCVGLGVVFGSSVAFAADWYAKDNLQRGHDPRMVRFEDGYALMSRKNKLKLWTYEDA